MSTTRDLAMAAINEHKGAVSNEPTINITVNPEPVKLAPQQYVIFKLVNEKMNRFTLDGICHDVINPKTDKAETMRLLRGASSVWTTDLTEMLKDKSYVNKNRIGIQFLGGITRVGINETQKLDFLRNHLYNVKDSRNGSGKYDFYEYDAVKQQRKKHDDTMKRVQMISLVTSMEENVMIKLALFLGIKPYEDEIGLPRTAEGFRTELMLLADKKHEEVAKYINSPEVEVSYLVRKAIVDAKIDLTNGNAMWANGGGFICRIPKSEKPLQYLTNFALEKTDEGKVFKEQLETRT